METVTQTRPARQPKARGLVTRIAVGIDGGPEGNDAAALGRTLAEATGGNLVLVAVHPDPLLLPPFGAEWSELRAEARAMLRKARAHVAPGARTVIETDFSVPRALHRVVHRHQMGILVLGSSRRGPEGKVRIGTRTRQLLSHLESALAVAPRGYNEREREGVGLARIGVGYEGGPESQAALELAGSLAAGSGAELELVAVVDDRMPPVGWPHFGHGGADHPEWEDIVLAEVERRRVDTQAAAEASGAPARVEIERGRPADAILELSQRVDLVVIGSRRWGHVARVLLGSTGEALLRDAGCPVIVVPRPAD